MSGPRGVKYNKERAIPEKAELLRKERAESGGSSEEGDGRAAEGNMMAARPYFFRRPAIGKEIYHERF